MAKLVDPVDKRTATNLDRMNKYKLDEIIRAINENVGSTETGDVTLSNQELEAYTFFMSRVTR